MELKKKELVGANQYELEIKIDQETFEAAVNDAYLKNREKIKIDGFRPGKAPRKVIERMYGKGVFYEDAIDALFPDAYKAAIEEAGIEPVARPDVDIVSTEDGLTLKAIVFAKPNIETDVKIEGYLGIEAERVAKTASDEDVDAEIKQAATRNSRTVEVNDRAAAMDDVANIDFDGYVDGVAFDGGKADNFDLKLGSGQFIPGFEDQIVGKNIGDEFDVEVTFPEEYHAAELAGKPAVFKVKLNGLKMTELPEIDDEFAKDVSEFDTLDEYKSDLRAKIQSRYDTQADREFDEKLHDKLVELLVAEIPEAMFANEVENQVRDFDYNLRMQGIDLNTYLTYMGMDLDKFRTQARPQAERQVKIRLALEKIASLENIAVTDEEVDAEYDRLASIYGVDAAQVREFAARADVEADLKVTAAMKLVREKAVAPKA